MQVPAAAIEGGVSISTVEELLELGVTGLGTEDSPWVLEGLVSTFPNGTAISITGLPEAHLKLKGVNATGKVGLFVSGVKNLEIENLTAEGVEAVILQDIEELKVRRIDATARDTAIHIAGVEKGDVKDLLVRKGNDGVVLQEYTGTVVLGDLRVANNGVVADDFRGYIQNMIVQGECAGIGLTFTGGNPNLIGNAAHCAETGILITEARNATMNGDAVAFARDGIVVRETRLEARGLVVKAVEGAGIVVTGANATLASVTVTNARTGIALSDGAFAVVGTVVTDVEEDALLVENARLCESGGLYTSARTGMRFASVEGQIAAGCGGGVLVIAGPPAPTAGTTTIDDVETGIEFTDTAIDAGTLLISDLWGEGVGVRALRGARTGAFPWQTLKVQNLAGGMIGTGIVANEGADVSVKDFHADGLASLATLGSGARLKLLAGTTGLFQPNERGFRVTDRAMLDMKSVTATMTKGPFVHANDSFVRDDASAVAGVFPGGRVEEEGFRLLRADVHLKNSRVTNARLGVYVEGLPEGIEGKPPVAPRFEGLYLAYSREGGIQLVDTAAEVTGGTILYSGVRPNPFFLKPPAGTAHGILARNSGFVLAGGLRVNTNDGDGLHWDGGTSVPASSLFPPGPDGKSASTPRIDQVTFSSNVGNGIAAQNAARELGFRIERSTVVLNRGNGADFRDVNVQISDSEFSDNDGHGIRSVWTQPGKDEVFDIRKSAFGNSCCDGNTLNGVDLTGHGAKTSIQNSYFNDTGTNLGVLLPEASYGHHVALWNSTRGAGPLVANNWFGDSYYCAIKLNRSNARIYENAFRSVISGSDGYNGFTCGVFAQRVAAYEVKGNRFGVIGLGVLSANSSGSIVGNRANATGPGLAWIEGDGSQTVSVTDNRVVSGTRNVGTPRYATDIFVAACEAGSLSSMICFSNVGGSIARNELDGGASRTDPRCPTDPWVRVECRLGQATRMILVRRGPATPEIFANNITTKGFGLDLWTPPGCCLGSDRSQDAGQWYDGANRIHDNVFDTYLSEGDTSSRITAIRDRHGTYGGDPPRHDAPTGANVAGNTFLKGAYVECHYSGYDYVAEQFIVDTRYACTNGAGRQTVMSHAFSGSAGASGPQAHPPFQDLTTRERTPGDLRTTVRDVPSVDRGFSIGTPTLRVTRTQAVRTFEFHGVATWTEAGFWYGKMRDSEGDIRIELLVDGAVVKSMKGTDASPYGETIRRANVTFTWQAPAEGLYEVKLRVSLASKTKDPALGNQAKEAMKPAWSGTGPHLLGIESNRGTVFIQAVPIPGGVRLTAKALWGAGETGTGYVIFKYLGRERRAFGSEPSIVVQPPTDTTSPGGDILTVEAVGFMRQTSEPSNAVSLRLKIIPFPAAILAYLAPGETEVNFGADDNVARSSYLDAQTSALEDLGNATTGGGTRTISYKWEIVFPTLDKEFKTSVPGIAGAFAAKAAGGIKITADSSGGGTIGPQGSVKLQGRSANSRYDFEFAGKVDGSGVVQVDDVRFKGIVLVVKLEGDVFAYLLVSDFVPAVKGLTSIPFLGKYADFDRFLRVGFGLGLETEGSWQLEGDNKNNCARIEGWKCTGTLNIKPRITLKLTGQLSKDLSAELYGKGSLYFVIVSPPPDDPKASKRPFGLKETGLEGELGLTVKVYSYEKQWKIVWSSKTASPTRTFNLTSETEWAIPPRTWTTGGDLDPDGRNVLRNLTGDAAPTIAYRGEEAFAAWVKDDLAKEWPRSGEIALARRTPAGGWTSLGTLTADALADAAPAVAPLAGGRWLVSWVRNLDASLTQATPLTAGTGKPFAIASAVVDPGTALPAATVLAGTDDGILDHGALSLAATDGSGLVVWTKNSANSLSATTEAPDVVYAARASGAGLGAPVVAFPGDVAKARAFAWDGTKLWMAASRDDGSIVLLSSDLAGTVAETPIGSAGDAPPLLALTTDAGIRRVAWLSPNGTGPAAKYDLVETTVGAPSTTRIVADAVGPDSLAYADGGRGLVWTSAHGDGTGLWAAAEQSGAWQPPGLLASGIDDERVVAAALRPGGSFEVATRALKILESTAPIDYSGPNMEDGSEAISVRHDVTHIEPGERTLRVSTRSLPAAPATLAPLETRQVFATTPADGTVRLRAIVANVGNEDSKPRPARFALAPLDSDAPPIFVNATIPPIRNGSVGEVFAEAVAPAEATGAWTALLTADDLLAGNALVRLQPDWVLPQAGVKRDGNSVTFRLENAGPRAGTTRVLALAHDGTAFSQSPVASVALDVPAFGAATSTLTLPTSTGPVLLVANPPDASGAFDQARIGGSVALAEGATRLAEHLGTVTVPAGVAPFRVDLGRIAGVGRLVSATFDGLPVSFQTTGSVVEGSLTVVEGVHEVILRLADFTGGERTLRLAVRTPGASGGDGGSSGDGGTGGDGAGGGDGTGGSTEPPPAPQPWYTKIAKFFGIPGASPMLLLATALVVALAARRRNERP